MYSWWWEQTGRQEKWKSQFHQLLDFSQLSMPSMSHSTHILDDFEKVMTAKLIWNLYERIRRMSTICTTAAAHCQHQVKVSYNDRKKTIQLPSRIPSVSDRIGTMEKKVIKSWCCKLFKRLFLSPFPICTAVDPLLPVDLIPCELEDLWKF